MCHFGLFTVMSFIMGARSNTQQKFNAPKLSIIFFYNIRLLMVVMNYSSTGECKRFGIKNDSSTYVLKYSNFFTRSPNAISHNIHHWHFQMRTWIINLAKDHLMPPRTKQRVSDLMWRMALWPSGIGSRLGRNRLWVRFLALSDIYHIPCSLSLRLLWSLRGSLGRPTYSK